MRHALYALALAGLLLAGCDRVFGLTPDEPSTGDDVVDAPPAGRIRRITLDPPTLEVLTDFTINVWLPNDGDLQTYAAASGADIRFFDENENELPAEVKYLEGTLEAYVSVPTVQHGTQLTLRYGADARTMNALDAWGSKYYAAWHMDGMTSERDSTHRDLLMTQHGTQPLPEPYTDGAVGAARVYYGSPVAAGAQQLCDETKSAFPPQNTSFALSLWINGDLAEGPYAQPFYAGGYTNNVGGFAIEQNKAASGSPWNVIYSGENGSHEELKITNVDEGNWIFLTVVFERLAQFKVHTYFNGDVVDAHSTSFSKIALAPTEYTCLGGDNSYGGLLDEVRVYKEMITDGWVAAEYANIAKRSTFMVVGAPE